MASPFYVQALLRYCTVYGGVKRGEVEVVRSIGKTISSILWLLAGLISLVVGIDLLYSYSLPSSTISANSANFQFAIGYVTIGMLFLIEAVLTFYGNKLAWVLSIPVAILMSVFVINELGKLRESGMVSVKYLSFYGFMLFVSVLTTVVVARFRARTERTNA